MKKRTKIIILSLMVVLLGVTGYLNIALNKSVKETGGVVAATSYFTAYRNERRSTRDQEMLYYDAIISNGDPADEAVIAAKAAKNDLIALMDKELLVEGLIKAQGFEDCVIAISDPKVNVVVKAESLTETEASQIWTTVMDQLHTPIRNIVIIYAD